MIVSDSISGLLGGIGGAVGGIFGPDMSQDVQGPWSAPGLIEQSIWPAPESTYEPSAPPLAAPNPRLPMYRAR